MRIPQYSVTYRILNPEQDRRSRTIDVYASEEEMRHLVSEGFLVMRDLFTSKQLDEMRIAVDRLAVEERARLPQPEKPTQYLRDLIDRDPVFFDLVRFAPTLSIARATLGPLVQCDAVDVRVAPANLDGYAVPWHTHLRVISKPVPPFFSWPQAIHCLLYLDPIDDGNGPLCVLPRSHRTPDREFPDGDNTDQDGQILLSVPAGTCVILHGNLWHRVARTRPGCGQRRVVIFGYLPSWFRTAEKGGTPRERLSDLLRAGADPDMRELLGEFYWT